MRGGMGIRGGGGGGVMPPRLGQATQRWSPGHTPHFVAEALSYAQVGPTSYGVGRGRPIDMSGPQLLANPPSFDTTPTFDPESDFSAIETTSDLTPSVGSHIDAADREFDIEYEDEGDELNTPDSSLASDVEETPTQPPSMTPLSISTPSNTTTTTAQQPKLSWSQILRTMPPIDAPLPMTVLPVCCQSTFVHNGDFNRLVQITQLELSATKMVGTQESFDCLFFFCDHERKTIHKQNMQNVSGHSLQRSRI